MKDSIILATEEASSIHIYMDGVLHTYDLGNPGDRLLAREAIQSPGVIKICADLKEAIKVLAPFGIMLSGPTFDVGIAYRLLGHQLSRRAQSVPLEDYCESLKRLAHDLEEQLRAGGMYRLFCDIEMPLAPVLADMEVRGVTIDTDALDEAIDTLQAESKEHQKSVLPVADEDFNINSSGDMGHLLFVDYGLPPMGRTATGYATDKKSLELLTKYSPLPQKVIDYRETETLLRKALEIRVNVKEDNAVHPVI